MNLKCISCFQLKRREINLGHGTEIVYDCPRLPYMTTIGGLMRPASGTIQGAETCPEDPLSHCAICSKTGIIHYGQDIVSICKEHDKAWGRWLDKHPERRKHLSPRGRAVKANWVEVFREFVEDMRSEVEGKP